MFVLIFILLVMMGLCFLAQKMLEKARKRRIIRELLEMGYSMDEIREIQRELALQRLFSNFF